MNKQIKQIIIGITTAILLGVIFTGCGQNKVEEGDLKTIRIGFPGTENVMFGLGTIAQDLEYFDQELEKSGYKVEYINFPAAGPAVNEALASKNIDVAIYADFPGIVSKSRGVPTTLLGIPEKSFYSQILIGLDSSIESISDLKGKKIGFTKGTYMHKNLLEILEKNGLKESDVELINVSTEGESALITKNIDALVTTEQIALQLVITKNVAKTLDTTRNYPEIAAQTVFVGRTEFVNENPEAIVAINKALIKAAELFREDQDKAYQSATKTGLNIDAVKALYNPEAPDFQLFQIGINEESIKKLQDTMRFLIDQKLINESFDVKTWADNSFYEKAK